MTATVRLPVSGQDVILRTPTGADELFVQEMEGFGVANGLELLRRLARPAHGEADWQALTVTDFEVLLLGVRQQLLGSRLRSDFDCPQCGERVEIAFELADYLAPIRPRLPNAVTAGDTPGWHQIDGAAFRLPTAGDQVFVEGMTGSEQLLAERCLDPADPPRKLRARIERSMAAMAPEVSRTIEGHCPNCGALLRSLFHAPSFVMAELKRMAASLQADIHLIASAYHWTEAAILDLPRHRRRDYAERIRADRTGFQPLTVT